MSNSSPRLDLPYLSPSQAQKHVTVNEALERIDAIAQLVVQQFEASSPPPAPNEGLIWALADNPTDVWAGQGGNLAISTPGNGWLFIQPSEGWRAYGLAETELRIFQGTAWTVQGGAGSASVLGVNATADTTNRLAVASDATLLTHDGGGHQLKVNKSSAADTASVLFQSNWSGHAEMGLAGETDFSIKVSDDGATWHQALVIDGQNGTVSGAALQSDALDSTTGKLLAVGGFGLGKAAALPSTNVDQAQASGFYYGLGGAATGASSGDNPFPTSAAGFSMQVMQSNDVGDAWTQLAISGEAPILRARVKQSGASPSPWIDVLVSFSGSGSAGRYIIHSDGTLICLVPEFELPMRSVSDCFADWTFPQGFIDASDVVVHAQLRAKTGNTDPLDFANDATPSADEILAPIVGEPTTSQVGIAVQRAAGATNFVSGDKLYCSIRAIGRWK